MFQHKKIFDNYYMAPIDFCFGDTEDFANYLRKRYSYETSVDKISGKAIVLEDKNSKSDVFIIFVEDVPDPIWLMSYIMHECNHVAFDILESRGVPILNDNSEVFCYYSEYLFVTFCKTFQLKKLFENFYKEELSEDK